MHVHTGSNFKKVSRAPAQGHVASPLATHAQDGSNLEKSEQNPCAKDQSHNKGTWPYPSEQMSKLDQYREDQHCPCAKD
eukprot:1140265-Pelagomonas_calceolata.AAC.3